MVVRSASFERAFASAVFLSGPSADIHFVPSPFLPRCTEWSFLQARRRPDVHGRLALHPPSLPRPLRRRKVIPAGMPVT